MRKHSQEPKGLSYLGALREEVLRGLGQPQKELPPKLLYDARGAELFERITALEEYYLTRTERAILQEHVDEMATLLGERIQLIEYGSGSSAKTRQLLDALREPVAYVPIDIAREQLAQTTTALRAAYPQMDILPVCADYTRPHALPTPTRPATRRVAYFPGSTIGNFDPAGAQDFLRHLAALCGPGGAALIGVDLPKDPLLLHAAYNDREGVTMAFNQNVLTRLNRELGADFELERFRHYAPYNPVAQRVEMHLVSRCAQTVRVGDSAFSFCRGESIWTESSYKYAPPAFARLAAAAGFTVAQVWMDPHQLFSVQYLVVQ
jgi:dimethylhistidine N-methyltransferase